MKLRKRIYLVLTICMIAIMLSACNGKETTNSNKQESIDNNKKDVANNMPISASEAFAQKGIWFYSDYSSGSSVPVTKDRIIYAVLVFDGNGNVTRYTTSYENEFALVTSSEILRFGDLKDLSEKEILSLAKEQDKKIFEIDMENKMAEVDHQIQELQESLAKPDNQNVELCQDWMNGASLKKEKLEETEYQEPKAQPFTLKIKTDGTGNQTAEEKLIYSYTSLTLSNYGTKTTTSEAELWKPTEIKEATITLNPYGGNSTVYDMQFTGLGSINKLIEEGEPMLMLDTPDAKGVEVD